MYSPEGLYENRVGMVEHLHFFLDLGGSGSNHQPFLLVAHSSQQVTVTGYLE